MSDNAKSAHIAFDPVDAGSGPFLRAALASLWRRKVLLVAIVATAFACGIAASFLMPARYTAQAYIRGEFFAAPDTVAKDDQSTTAEAMNLDLVRVIDTQSRLLWVFDPLARRVVHQLGLERLKRRSQSQLWPSAFFGSAAKTPEGEVDIVATRLLRGLSVSSDPRCLSACGAVSRRRS